MSAAVERVPARAWVVTCAGMAVNLCLGILYAWSVWKANLVGDPDHLAGTPMTGANAGWHYLTDAQGTWAYALCGLTFALMMIPGGRIQDRFGPRAGATAGGLFLAAGCLVAGLSRSYAGLLVGFGLMGGIGMGLGYAAATPAAVRWFGPHRRGLIVGLVVAGYGGAAIYIAPLARALIARYGISGSFIGLGLLFAVVVVIAGSLLRLPPPGYLPPAGGPARGPAFAPVDWSPRQMLRTPQYFGLVLMFLGSAQAGLLVIANAVPMLNKTASSIPLLATMSWIAASYGGLVNACGRVGTGLYSDRIGRSRAFVLNGAVCVVVLFLMPRIIASGNVALLFLAVGVAFWQYGGGLALMPAFTADFYGARNLGLNYGLVFLGWGLAFFVPQVAGYVKDATGSLDAAFIGSAILLAIAVGLALVLRRPEPMPDLPQD
jgi:OFA family oxalate/formate antiporter-like MFS transporter